MRDGISGNIHVKLKMMYWCRGEIASIYVDNESHNERLRVLYLFGYRLRVYKKQQINRK